MDYVMFLCDFWYFFEGQLQNNFFLQVSPLYMFYPYSQPAHWIKGSSLQILQRKRLTELF